ncbi:hypothetical protein K474DRAFT_1666461 [Panus rudis PR-1116 ss-1]|nr:hypothetical protein K474DRAFT_1666461 [Panus rudis PR-1116 ss-1]
MSRILKVIPVISAIVPWANALVAPGPTLQSVEVDYSYARDVSAQPACQSGSSDCPLGDDGPAQTIAYRDIVTRSEVPTRTRTDSGPTWSQTSTVFSMITPFPRAENTPQIDMFLCKLRHNCPSSDPSPANAPAQAFDIKDIACQLFGACQPTTADQDKFKSIACELFDSCPFSSSTTAPAVVVTGTGGSISCQELGNCPPTTSAVAVVGTGIVSCQELGNCPAN